jgi:hypothetical protein
MIMSRLQHAFPLFLMLLTLPGSHSWTRSASIASRSPSYTLVSPHRGGGGNPLFPSKARSSIAPPVKSTSAVAPPSENPLYDPKRQARASAACVACLVTWLVANYTPLTIVQAASATGLIACIVTRNQNIPWTVAVFCGALTGMSGNLLPAATLSTKTMFDTPQILPIVLLSSFVSYAYSVWDVKKWGVGIGGRLGTIACAANLVYSVLALVLRTIRRSGAGCFALWPASVQSLYTSLPAISSLLVSAALFQLSRQRTLHESTKDQPLSKVLHAISKIALIWSLNLPMFFHGKVQPVEYLGTILSLLIGNQMVHRTAPSLGPILPTSLVGLLGAALCAGPGHYHITAPKLFMGALMGLTTLPNFGLLNFVQSSVLGASLFHMGLLEGFGGRLGTLAYIGVLFAK